MNEAKGRCFRKERTNTFPMATKSRSLMDVHRLQTCWNSPSTFLESSDSFKKTFRAPLGNVKAPLVFPLKWNASLVWPPSTPRTHCLPATTSPTLLENGGIIRQLDWTWQWLQPFFWFWAPDMKCTFGITLIPLMPLRWQPNYKLETASKCTKIYRKVSLLACLKQTTFNDHAPHKYSTATYTRWIRPKQIND